MSNINNKHLASHQLTAAEYRARYPGMPMRSEEHAQRLYARSVIANATRKGVPRSDEDKRKMREGQAQYYATHQAPSRPMADDQKRLLSELALQRYADGFVHPNTGKHLSDQVREKISLALHGRKVGPEIALKAIETKRQLGYDLAPFRGRCHTPETKARIAAKVHETYMAQRDDTRAHMLERMREVQITLLNDPSADVFHLRCDVCGYQFTRTPQQFQPSKFHLRICDQCYPQSAVSDQEDEVATFIRSLTPAQMIRSDMEILTPLHLDIYLPEWQLAIEYCGLYWHSDKARYYHRYKFDECRRKGIRLITIFEDEWVNLRSIVESMLRNAFHGATRKINARSCVVQELTWREASNFLTENHIQGDGRRSTVRYGLWLGDELVSVMTFIDQELSHKGNGWEIKRFASKLNCSVRGAASKLFSAFIRDSHPEKVISYADLRWGEGRVYAALGFRFIGDTQPGYCYVRSNDLKRYSRFSLRKNSSDPSDVSEKELRQRAGWRILWDVGCAKWEYSP